MVITQIWMDRQTDGSILRAPWPQLKKFKESCITLSSAEWLPFCSGLNIFKYLLFHTKIMCEDCGVMKNIYKKLLIICTILGIHCKFCNILVSCCYLIRLIFSYCLTHSGLKKISIILLKAFSNTFT